MSFVKESLLDLNLKQVLNRVLSKLFQSYIEWDEERFYAVLVLCFVRIRSFWKCYWKEVVEITIEDPDFDLTVRLKMRGNKQAYLSKSHWSNLEEFIKQLPRIYPGFTKRYIGTTDEWEDIYLCWKESDQTE